MSFSKNDSWRMIVIPGAMNFIKSRILMDFVGDDCRVTNNAVKVAIKPKLSLRNVRRAVIWLQILDNNATVFKTGPLGDFVLVKIHCRLINKCSCSLIACRSDTFRRTYKRSLTNEEKEFQSFSKSNLLEYFCPHFANFCHFHSVSTRKWTLQEPLCGLLNL